MHRGGTSTTGKPFWRRASRSRAAGAKIDGDGEDGFLLSRIGGMGLYLRATTACLSAIIVMQIVNVFLCRSSVRSVRSVRSVLSTGLLTTD